MIGALITFGSLLQVADRFVRWREGIASPTNSTADDFLPHDPAAAFARAKSEDRPLVIMFHAAWCRICDQMERTTFADERVQERLAELIALKVDVGAGHESIVQGFHVMGIPTTVIATPMGDPVVTRSGYIGSSAYFDLLDEHGLSP